MIFIFKYYPKYFALLFLCLMSMFAFPADPLAETASLVAQLSLKKTPEDFMQHLRDCEKESDSQVEVFYSYQKVNEGPKWKKVAQNIYRCFNLNNFDQENFNLLDESYLKYFYALASSLRLSDEQKLQPIFVKVPFFRQLENAPQSQKCFATKLITGECTKQTYPIWRLLMAGMCYTGVNLNMDMDELKPTPVRHALFNGDHSLLKKLLDAGANPNASCGLYSPLLYVRTMQDALLLLKYGADVKMQYESIRSLGGDLIGGLCNFGAYRKDPYLIALYLKHIALDETNAFGKEWFNLLALYANNVYIDLAIRIKLLLDFGCQYNERQAKHTIDNRIYPIGQRKEEVKQLFQKAFERDKKKKQNLVQGLRNRQIAGHRMHGTKVNMHAVRERATASYDMRQKYELIDSFLGINRSRSIMLLGPDIAEREE